MTDKSETTGLCTDCLAPSVCERDAVCAEHIAELVAAVQAEEDKEISMRWHIQSPRYVRDGGAKTLCGLHNDADRYNGLDEAYRAHVEGRPNIGEPCRLCLSVALIAMGVSNDVR